MEPDTSREGFLLFDGLYAQPGQLGSELGYAVMAVAEAARLSRAATGAGDYIPARNRRIGESGRVWVDEQDEQIGGQRRKIDTSRGRLECDRRQDRTEETLGSRIIYYRRRQAGSPRSSVTHIYRFVPLNGNASRTRQRSISYSSIRVAS